MLQLVVVAFVSAIVTASSQDHNTLVQSETQIKGLHGPQLMTRELRTFEETVKEKDLSFRTYTDMLQTALTDRLKEIDSEIEETTRNLEAKTKSQRILTLQLGELQTTADHESVEDILSGTANTLMECASAKTSHDQTSNDEDMMERLLSTTIAYVDALGSNPDIRPAQSACLDSVRNVIQDVATQHATLVEREGIYHNATVEVCLESQKYLLTESAWATANEIPLVEDVVAIRGELRAVQDTLSQLQSNLVALNSEKEIKNQRILSLQKEVREHDSLIKLQIETFDRLRSLLTM